MKHLKSYKLFESLESEMNFDKIVETLSTECSEFLEILEKFNIEGVFRGHKIWDEGNITKGFWKITPFEKRIPRDTKSTISKLLDDGLENKFGIPLRSQGIFASKDMSIAKDYGRFKNEAFLFFPKNGFRYFWNPEVDDLFTLLRDDTSWYDKEHTFWKPTEWLDFHQIVGGYREGGIQFVKYQEITFICDEYYLLDLDYYDQFLNYFLK